jgi:hypothetical protein
VGKFELWPISTDLAFENDRLEIAERMPASPARDKTIAAIVGDGIDSTGAVSACEQRERF